MVSLVNLIGFHAFYIKKTTMIMMVLIICFRMISPRHKMVSALSLSLSLSLCVCVCVHPFDYTTYSRVYSLAYNRMRYGPFRHSII